MSDMNTVNTGAAAPQDERAINLPRLPEAYAQIGEFEDEMGDVWEMGQVLDFARAAVLADRAALPAQAVALDDECRAIAGPLLELDGLLANLHKAVWDAAEGEAIAFDDAGNDQAKAIQKFVRELIRRDRAATARANFSLLQAASDAHGLLSVGLPVRDNQYHIVTALAAALAAPAQDVAPSDDPGHIKPCPFCGQDLDVRNTPNNPKARCRTEGCKGKQLPVLRIDDPSDIEAWNRRAAPPAVAKDVAPSDARLPPPELTWLYTHCKAIGMDCKSESEKWEHDIALYISRLQGEVNRLNAAQPAAQPADAQPFAYLARAESGNTIIWSVDLATVKTAAEKYRRPLEALYLGPATVKESVTVAGEAQDAARYRWLRDRDLGTVQRGGVFAGMTPANVVLNGEDLDSAIDAARTQEGAAS